MRKILVVGAALALFTIPALAQDPPPKVPPTVPPTAALDQQVEQSQMRLYAAQAEHYLALARRLQAANAEAATQSAATAAWWAAWWLGMYPPTPAPAASAEPPK